MWRPVHWGLAHPCRRILCRQSRLDDAHGLQGCLPVSRGNIDQNQVPSSASCNCKRGLDGVVCQQVEGTASALHTQAIANRGGYTDAHVAVDEDYAPWPTTRGRPAACAPLEDFTAWLVGIQPRNSADRPG